MRVCNDGLPGQAPTARKSNPEQKTAPKLIDKEPELFILLLIPEASVNVVPPHVPGAAFN